MKRALAVLVVAWLVYREWQARRTAAVVLAVLADAVDEARRSVEAATEILRGMDDR